MTLLLYPAVTLSRFTYPFLAGTAKESVKVLKVTATFRLKLI